MELKNINSIYFLGIGGIGMSALARYFKSAGKEVSGYDKSQTRLTDFLVEEGIKVHYDERPELFTKVPDLVVYTPAVPKEHQELLWLKENGAVIKKRSEILGIITQSTFTVGVAGTHGKTTITSMVAHLLKVAGRDPFAFIGGISKNYKSNLILSQTNNLTVVEADEFDRSFLQLYPDIAVISAMDADHLDIYGDKENLTESFNLYAKQIKPNGTLVLKNTLEIPKGIESNVVTYGTEGVADISARNIIVKEGCYYFDVYKSNEVLFSVKSGVPGIHNVENALASVAVGDVMKVSYEQIKKSLETYQGVLRRFDYRINDKRLVFIDDYAHHPEEIRAFLKSVRQLYPQKKITGIFQPHLFSRTRDFADDFAKSLELLDEVILLDIYPAREKPIDGINSAMLLSKIQGVQRKDLYTKEELVEQLIARKLEVLLTLGAGDIDCLVDPIEKSLINMLKVYNSL